MMEVTYTKDIPWGLNRIRTRSYESEEPPPSSSGGDDSPAKDGVLGEIDGDVPRMPVLVEKSSGEGSLRPGRGKGFLCIRSGQPWMLEKNRENSPSAEARFIIFGFGTYQELIGKFASSTMPLAGTLYPRIPALEVIPLSLRLLLHSTRGYCPEDEHSYKRAILASRASKVGSTLDRNKNAVSKNLSASKGS